MRAAQLPRIHAKEPRMMGAMRHSGLIAGGLLGLLLTVSGPFSPAAAQTNTESKPYDDRLMEAFCSFLERSRGRLVFPAVAKLTLIVC